jgi:cell wall assembly regulator SMI1
MKELRQFAEKFNKSDKAKPLTQVDIDKLEHEFHIFLPIDYKTFLLNFGNVWTPDILDLIVDNESDIYDVQQFWSIDKIIYDKQNEWTSHVSPEIIPFASDSSGNIFAFLKHDLKSPTETAEIYFYDHDFETVEKISHSFKDWINEYNKL